MIKEGLFIVVSAPSGTGKTSICRAVLKLCPELHFSVSYTTRPPRPVEVNGTDYQFISEVEFRDYIVNGEFAEWAENYGYLYGTSKNTMNSILGKGHDLILDIEPAGAKVLKKAFTSGVFVFILPPSLDELKKRLYNRGSESEKDVAKRLDKALSEIQEIDWYDYVIFNEDINKAVDCLRSIYIAEKSRRGRMMTKIEDFYK